MEESGLVWFCARELSGLLSDNDCDQKLCIPIQIALQYAGRRLCPYSYESFSAGGRLHQKSRKYQKKFEKLSLPLL